MPSFDYLFGSGKPRVRIPAELAGKRELLAHLRMSEKEQAKIGLSNGLMYRTFTIPSGRKTRTIFAPDKRLKHLQRQISNLLLTMYRPRASTHGFVKGRSIETNAEVHAGKRHVLSLDLKDFFPSITQRRVIGLLHSLGIPSEVCSVISALCCMEGSLPQGAPSSPILSNLICFDLDRRLHKFCKANKLVFTRYADDISISTNGSPISLFAGSIPVSGRLSSELLSAELKECFSNGGFELNPEKTHFSSGADRKIVTGLIVNEFPNVERKFVREIRATLHDIERRGIVAAQERYRSRFSGGRRFLENHLRGELSFLGSVRGKGDPVFRSLADRFNKIFHERKLLVERTPAERLERAIWVLEWAYTSAKIDRLWKEQEAKGGSIVDVADSYQGTAFFLEGVGLVTAAHCLPTEDDEIDYFRIWHPSEPFTTYNVIKRKRCEIRDVAILDHYAPPNSFESLKKYRVMVRGGDRARAYGFTDYQKGDPVTSSAGEISHVNIRSSVKFLNLSFKVGQGMSGGPVFDNMTRVVGVIHKGGPNELRDYAVAIDEVFNLAEE